MRKWIKRILLIAAIVIVTALMLLGYAYFIEPRRLVVTESELRVPNFDPELNGLKIVAISDIHAGSNHVTHEKLREIVAAANQQNPDLILLLGDYVSQSDGTHSPLVMPVNEIAENLKGFSARYGIYGVIGNHDWWYDQAAVRAALEPIGIRVLDNETVRLEIHGKPVYIWGIEDLWKHDRVPLEPFEAIGEKRNIIAITHNPDSLLKTPSGISLMLAGHSHGGQVNIPFYGRKAFVNDPRFMYGEAVVDGKPIYVTAGIGTSILPLRFRVPPEIAVLTIYSTD